MAPVEQSTVRDSRPTEWFWLDKALLDTHGPRIGMQGVAVYAVLARYADSKGCAFPSLNTIARTLDCMRATVVKALVRLEKEGLIRRHQRRAPKGDHTSTLYTLVPVPAAEADSPPCSKIEQPLVQNLNNPCIPREQPLVQNLNNPCSKIEHEQDPLNKIQIEQDPLRKERTPPPPRSAKVSSRYSAAFEQFWGEYPIKKGKWAAWQAWQKMECERIAADIIVSVVVHRAHDPAWQRGFIKHPATYLNQACWEDDLRPDPVLTTMSQNDERWLAKVEDAHQAIINYQRKHNEAFTPTEESLNGVQRVSAVCHTLDAPYRVFPSDKA